MIVWREKLRAFGLHFLLTLALSLAAAALIFLVWYPDPFQTMLGGTKFFLLVSGCDLVLGPLTSLIIYNSKKTRRALVFDYTVIGIVQLAAFVYGVLSLASSRPIYVAFVHDRFEVVTAAEIADEDLQSAEEPYRSRPKFGPVLVGTQRPATQQDRNELLLSAMEGKDRQNFPRYYVPFEQNVAEIKRLAGSMDLLEERRPEARPLIAAAMETFELPRERLRFLPIRSARGFWTALLDGDTGRPLDYLPVDGYPDT